MKPVTEDELKAKSTGIRITEEDLNANISSVHYFTAGDGVAGSRDGIHLPEDPRSLGLLTFCVIVLQNGFTVTGESACADPANFNPEIGQRLAYNQAKGKIWALMGYELRSKLMAEQKGWLDGDARRNGAA